MSSSSVTVGHGRARVLEALIEIGAPATVADLRRSTGLGASTLREHLAALAETGRVTRTTLRSGRRGRPSIAYVARQPDHEGLAQTLVDALAAAPDPQASSTAAEVAGRSWGRRVVAQLDRLLTDDTTDLGRVELALQHAGFSHERDGGSLRITACPLLELARSSPEIVCRAHRGMMQGVLDATDGVDLVPFDPRGGCLVRLS